MSTIQVFVSFDIEHDGQLYELLLAQSRIPGFGFAVSGGSEYSMGMEVGSERVRRQIREADQMIVICSEHTAASSRVGAEILIAQEEGTPYFLLWGRREIMCTKPIGARASDGMYSWTRQILLQRILLTSRNAEAGVAAETANDAVSKR